MTDNDHGRPEAADAAEPAADRPLATSDAASAPVRRGFTLRGRKWVYGATLAAAGVIAGSGVTYAVVGTAPASQVQTFSGGSGQRGGPMGGGAPDGQAPGGQPPADGSAADGQST